MAKQPIRFTEYFEQAFNTPFQIPEGHEPNFDLSEFTSDTDCGQDCIKAVDAAKAFYWYASNAGVTFKLIALCREACEVMIYG